MTLSHVFPETPRKAWPGLLSLRLCVSALNHSPTKEERLLAAEARHRESGITIEVTLEELHRIHGEMHEAMQALERVRLTIRELAGPQPGPVPSHLLGYLAMGAGWARSARDMMAWLFHARAKREGALARKKSGEMSAEQDAALRAEITAAVEARRK